MKNVSKNLVMLLCMMLLMIGMNSIMVDAAAKIPSGAGNYNGHYYYVYPSGTCSSYDAAVEYCEKLGGHLATISSQKENQYIYKYMTRKGYDIAYFGYYRTSNGFAWVDGSKTVYTNWYPGEPETQKYARYKSGGNGTWCDDYWGNWNCSAFICEWDYTVEVSETKIVLDQGDFTTIDAVIKLAGSTVSNAKVTYKSDNIGIAKVSSKGKLVAVAPGSCKITVKYKDASKTINIIVNAKKVSGLGVVSCTRNSIKLSWKKQKGVSGYQVWMYDPDLEEYVVVKNVSKDFNSATINNLKKGTTYKFKVRSYVKGGSKKYYSEYSSVYKVKTK